MWFPAAVLLLLWVGFAVVLRFVLGLICGCFAGFVVLSAGGASGFVSWMLGIVYTSVLVASLIFGVLLWLVVCGTVSLVFGGLRIAFMVVLVSSLVIVLGLMVLWVLFIGGLWLFCWFIVVLCVEFVVLYFWVCLGLYGCFGFRVTWEFGLCGLFAGLAGLVLWVLIVLVIACRFSLLYVC